MCGAWHPSDAGPFILAALGGGARPRPLLLPRQVGGRPGQAGQARERRNRCSAAAAAAAPALCLLPLPLLGTPSCRNLNLQMPRVRLGDYTLNGASPRGVAPGLRQGAHIHTHIYSWLPDELGLGFSPMRTPIHLHPQVWWALSCPARPTASSAQGASESRCGWAVGLQGWACCGGRAGRGWHMLDGGRWLLPQPSCPALLPRTPRTATADQAAAVPGRTHPGARPLPHRRGPRAGCAALRRAVLYCAALWRACRRTQGSAARPPLIPPLPCPPPCPCLPAPSMSRWSSCCGSRTSSACTAPSCRPLST